MSALTVTDVSAQEIIEAWRWRDKFGTFLRVEQMDTGHIFNTLRMIWNHSMPASAITHDFIRHTFTGFYTPEYLRSAILPLTIELSKRKDMLAYQERHLKFMIEWLRTHRLQGVNDYVRLN